MGVYDEQFKQHVIKDVILSDVTEIVDVEVPFNFPVSAILINVNDHGYAKIRFDTKSLDAFVNSLHKISDPVSRATFWRQSWLMVQDRKMSSLKYFEFVNKQLPHESVSQTLAYALMNLSALINYYLPTHLVLEKQKEMFNTLTELLANDSIDETNKATIVDNMFSFASSTDHVNLCLRWLDKSYIFKGDDENAKLVELSLKNKYSILKAISKDTTLTKETKLAVIDKTIGEDKSDIAVNTRETCLVGFPDPEAKAAAWKAITDPNSEESVNVRYAKMGGFFSWKQKDLATPYIQKFYEEFPNVFKTLPFRYVQNFFYAMLPRMDV